MKDLTSWSFSDHENGEDSAQNYTSMISRQLAPYSPRKHLVTHNAVKDWNPAAPARFLSSRKHMYRPVWSLPMIQRRTGWKCCGQMRTKCSSLASTQLAVFGGGGMLLSQEHHPHRHTWRWKHYAFGGVFLLRGQDNCTASKGWWMGPCTVRARALKPARASKMSRGWVFQHDNDPKQRSVSRRSTLRS